MIDSLRGLLERERIKMEDRNMRRQWALLDQLMNGFDRGIYKLAREAAVEDVTFAEELMKLEERWVRENILSPDELLSIQMGWKTPTSWSLRKR